MKLSSGLLAVVLLTIAVPVAAQSLGELAKKERERRKTVPPAAKTYTNDDLKQSPAPPPAAGGDPSKPGDTAKKADDPAKPGDPVTPVDPKAGPPKGADEKAQEAFWRNRMTTAREEQRRNEVFRDALQTKIDLLAAGYSLVADPFQRETLISERQKQIAELARVTGEIEKSVKQIADIEDEARRTGVPPGWLR
jgi:hypothetical protein